MIPRVLTIAGSDSGGGAGIEADIKTITSLGGYACTAITALTAQNTLGVFGVQATPAAFIKLTIATVLMDIGADAIKSGMLATAEIIDAVADSLPEDIPYVLDPVMVATSGAILLRDDAIDALRTRLVPRATLITPNLPEAAKLTGLQLDDEDQRLAAGHALIDMGATAALIKGGHDHRNDGTITDLLVHKNGFERFVMPRIDTRHTHGTGCTLSAAIATGLAHKMSMRASVERARVYLQSAILHAPEFGHGNGPVNHLAG